MQNLYKLLFGVYWLLVGMGSSDCDMGYVDRPATLLEFICVGSARSSSITCLIRTLLWMLIPFVRFWGSVCWLIKCLGYRNPQMEKGDVVLATNSLVLSLFWVRDLFCWCDLIWVTSPFPPLLSSCIWLPEEAPCRPHWHSWVWTLLWSGCGCYSGGDRWEGTIWTLSVRFSFTDGMHCVKDDWLLFQHYSQSYEQKNVTPIQNWLSIFHWSNATLI